MSFSDLKQKDVINICEAETGKPIDLILNENMRGAGDSGRQAFQLCSGLMGNIPWRRVRRIGDDEEVEDASADKI
ncbi:MAG: PRC-barrel domain-containing protein [Christensenellales bacterium]